MKKEKIPKIEYGQPLGTILPTPEFSNTIEIFKDPQNISLNKSQKEWILEELEKAYTQAWISQKAVEITYQRFIHNYYDKSNLVLDALKSELARTQNEIKIAEGMLQTIQEWKRYIKQ